MSDRETIFAGIIHDTLWMARRYADGRSTYSTSTVNEAIDRAKAAGLWIESDATLPDPNYATDGMFGRWDPESHSFVRAKP